MDHQTASDVVAVHDQGFYEGYCLYRQGRVADDDPGSAVAWWKCAAESGDGWSMYHLGRLRELQGRIDDDDPDSAVAWLKRAIHSGDTEASEPGLFGGDRVPGLGIANGRHNAVMRAINSLGNLRGRQGRTDDNDPDGAVTWWKVAANDGNLFAINRLGLLREDQSRVADDDPDGAVGWWKRAATAGAKGATSGR